MPCNYFLRLLRLVFTWHYSKNANNHGHNSDFLTLSDPFEHQCMTSWLIIIIIITIIIIIIIIIIVIIVITISYSKHRY